MTMAVVFRGWLDAMSAPRSIGYNLLTVSHDGVSVGVVNVFGQTLTGAYDPDSNVISAGSATVNLETRLLHWGVYTWHFSIDLFGGIAIVAAREIVYAADNYNTTYYKREAGQAAANGQVLIGHNPTAGFIGNYTVVLPGAKELRNGNAKFASVPAVFSADDWTVIQAAAYFSSRYFYWNEKCQYVDELGRTWFRNGAVEQSFVPLRDSTGVRISGDTKVTTYPTSLARIVAGLGSVWITCNADGLVTI